MKTMKYALAVALGLIALLAPSAARADEIYQFSFTSTNGLITPFSFSFTVPTFVAGGDTPAFTPFDITDGTHTWTIANDLVDSSGCWVFGTATGATLSPCTIAIAPGTGGAFFAVVNGGLPTATGTYSVGGPSILAFLGGTETPDFAGTLNISAVPEPSSLLLLATGLLGLMGMGIYKKRLA